MPKRIWEQEPLRHASAENPCPVCQHVEGCVVDRTGKWAVCQRTESDRAARTVGWVHRLADPVPPAEPVAPSHDPNTPVPLRDPVPDPTECGPGPGGGTPRPNFRDALRGTDVPNRSDDPIGADDLSAFDNASGVTFVPAGPYVCVVVRGELLTTKTHKLAYRLTFDVSEGPHTGFRVRKYYMLDTTASANWAKAALAPFGIRSSADLRKPFPGPGRVVAVRALVVIKPRPDGTDGNDVERFTVIDDRSAPPNPNLVDPDDYAGREGGAP